MFCYEEQTPQTELHYSAADYAWFKRDAFQSARRINASIGGASRDSGAKSSREASALERYTSLWERLPRVLLENGVEPREAIGIVEKKMARVAAVLRKSAAQVVLQEQQRQVELAGYCDPRRLAEEASLFSKISASLASSKAGEVAR